LFAFFEFMAGTLVADCLRYADLIDGFEACCKMGTTVKVEEDGATGREKKVQICMLRAPVA
jgi:hypothetical protein